MEDDELAEQIVKSGKISSSSPSIENWSPSDNYLAMIGDRMGEIFSAIIATRGGKPPKVQPVSRPVTAYDRIRSRVAWEKHRSLVDEVNRARRK